MAYRGYTPAQKKATNKYQKENMEQIALRVKKGTRERWHDAAERAGESYRQFILNAVEDKIKNLSLETPSENLPRETRSENLPPDTPSNNPMQL